MQLLQALKETGLAQTSFGPNDEIWYARDYAQAPEHSMQDDVESITSGVRVSWTHGEMPEEGSEFFDTLEDATAAHDSNDWMPSEDEE